MRASILCFGALGALGVVGAVAGLGGCSGTSEPAPGSSSGSGSGAAALPRPGASPVSADEAVKIRHYLDARYRPSDVRHSFRTSLGQDIDCIDFFAQPGVRALAAQGHPITSIPAVPDLPANVRPSEPSGEEVEQGVAFDGSLDVAGSARACPVGTVPQVRLTVEQVQHAGGLEAFRKALHAKSAPPKVIRRPDEYGSCGGDYPGYAHVVGSLLTPFTDPIVAGASVMSIYGPTIPDAAVDYGHSIAQTWMAGYSADY
ncbi:MAG TPA: hypothetical protein VIF09_05410, partial [Polyangiaceae bacterium]